MVLRHSDLINKLTSEPEENLDATLHFKDGGSYYTYNNTNYMKKNGKWYKSVNNTYVPLTKGNVEKRSEVLNKHAKPVAVNKNIGFNFANPGHPYGTFKATNLEDKIDQLLGSPMQKAWNISSNNLDPGEDPLDNVRHSMAGYYTARSLGSLPGVPAANALGLAHEMGTLFKDPREWKYKLQEAGEDMFNNFVGTLLSPLPEKQAYSVVRTLSDNNLLPDGLALPHGVNAYVKQNGGFLAPNIPTHYNFEGTPIYRDTTSLPFKDGGKREKRKNNTSSDNEHWKNVITGKELQGIRARNLEDFELKKYIDTLPNILYSQNDFNKHISTDEAIKRAHTAGNREEEDYLRSLKEQGIEKIQSFGEVTVSANKDVEKNRLKLLDEWRILNNTIKKYHKEKGLPDWQGAYAGTDMKKLQANIKDLRQRYEQEKDYYKEVSKTLDLLKKEMPEKYGDVKLKNFLTADTYTDINRDLTSIDKKYALGKGENVTAKELDKALGIKLNSAKSFREGIGRQFDPLGYTMSKEDWQQWKNQHPLGDHNLFYDAQGFSEDTNKLIMGLLAGAAGGAAVQGQVGSNMLKGLNWIGEAGVGPVTVNNILSGLSAYHLGHSVPEFVKNPTLRNLGSMSIDVLGASPVGLGVYKNIPKIQDTSKALRMWGRDKFNPAINRKINFWDAFKYDDYINIGDPSKLAGYREALITRPQATTGRWYSLLSKDPTKAEETLKYLLPASELGQGRHGVDVVSDVNRYLARRGQLSAEGQATGQLSRVGTGAIEKELSLIHPNYQSYSKRKFNAAIEELITKRKKLEDIPITNRTEQQILELNRLDKAIKESSLLEGKMRSIPRSNEIEELLPGFQKKHNLTDSQINLVRDFSKEHSSYFTHPEYTANTPTASALRKAMRDPTFVSESEYLRGIPKDLVEITPSNWSSVKNIITNPSKQGTREFILEHPELAASYKYLNVANELRPFVKAIHEAEIVKATTDVLEEPEQTKHSSGGHLNFKKNKIYKTSELY